MKATIYVVIPNDAPDPLGMIRRLLEPYRWNYDSARQGAWYYWDYWYFVDPLTGDQTAKLRAACCFDPTSLNPNHAAGLITADGQLHDWYIPPGERNNVVERNWSRIDVSLEDHCIVAIRVHS